MKAVIDLRRKEISLIQNRLARSALAAAQLTPKFEKGKASFLPKDISIDIEHDVYSWKGRLRCKACQLVLPVRRADKFATTRCSMVWTDNVMHLQDVVSAVHVLPTVVQHNAGPCPKPTGNFDDSDSDGPMDAEARGDDPAPVLDAMSSPLEEQQAASKGVSLTGVEMLHGSFSFGSAKVNISHSLACNRGLIWCWQCGAFSTGLKAVKLTIACRPCPNSKAVRHIRGRLLDGKTPRDKVEWPEAEGSEVAPAIMVFLNGPTLAEQRVLAAQTVARSGVSKCAASTRVAARIIRGQR